MYNEYRAGLIAKGVSAVEADQQMDIIERLMRERLDAYRAMFNNIYRTDNPVFSTQPNALLVATVEERQPGRALDIGIGQGRNSVFLALKGWDVTGFDASDEGVATAARIVRLSASSFRRPAKSIRQDRSFGCLSPMPAR
jgi:2-polyprenyl-3-methyl-5-hydroxy-6-metoxy-1,4-benzoquinol methylase